MDRPFSWTFDRLGVGARWRIAAVAAAVSLGGVGVGCLAYPDSSERIDDDVVFTNYRSSTDFSSYKTFAVDPTIHVAEVQADGSIENSDADQESADQVIETVVKNMVERGYTQVSPEEKPDLGITLTAISGLTIGAISGGYYWGYYGYYWGYPGWGYYYPYDVYYSYRTGTLILDMADLKNSDYSALPDGGLVDGDGGPVDPDAGLPPGALPIVWNMGAYKAAVDDGDQSKVRAAQQAINQAFAQSPYLRSE